MAERNFGTGVYTVLENMQQSTQNVDAAHVHRVRRALMNVMRGHRHEEWDWTERKGGFQTAAGEWNYDTESKLGVTGISRVKKLWWADDGPSTPGSGLYPYSEEGVRQADYAEITRLVGISEDQQSYVDAWAWRRRKRISVYPVQDGTKWIHLLYIRRSKVFSYKLVNGLWAYFVDGSEKTDNSVDEVEDEDGFLEHAFELWTAQATRDLYFGAYQASDPKKSLAATWRDRTDDELNKLYVRRRQEQGTKRAKPYYIPGD